MMRAWLILILFAGSVLSSVANTNETSVAMIRFHDRDLFELVNVSSVSAETRVHSTLRRLKRIANSPLFSTKDITAMNDDDLHVSAVMAHDEVIISIWEMDARHHGVAREKLAEQYKDAIVEVIEQYRKDYTTTNYMKGAGFFAIASLLFLLIWLVVRLVCKKEIGMIEKRFAGQKMFKFLDGDTIVSINANIVKFVRFVFMLWIFIFYLNLALSFFPWTYNLSARLFHMISTPVIDFGHAFVENLPQLFALLVLIVITILVLRGLKSGFQQIDQGRVRIKGFYRDWADPTYRLVRILIIVFAAVVAFPLIPGSSSPAFKGISIFMGVLVSLGSTSAVGNIVAGLVLTYMRPFVNDDFVEISGMRGIVESRGTFSTRLKTPTNEIISIPNASVSSNHIINFSRMAERGGVNVGTAVTIGYDVPWRKVHELLMASAEGVEDVLQAPPPKVLQLRLDDFYVEYKLIVTTKHPERRFPIRSHLHQNIQDNFAAAGVEIMSPHYQGNRDGDVSTIPDMGEM
jgi:small-conductance mechanosensitive channel